MGSFTAGEDVTTMLTTEPTLKRKRESDEARDLILECCQKKIKYTFKDPMLLWEALQGEGSFVQSISGRPVLRHNKTLAYLGDAVLSLGLRLQALDQNILIGMPHDKFKQVNG